MSTAVAFRVVVSKTAGHNVVCLLVMMQYAVGPAYTWPQPVGWLPWLLPLTSYWLRHNAWRLNGTWWRIPKAMTALCPSIQRLVTPFWPLPDARHGLLKISTVFIIIIILFSCRGHWEGGTHKETLYLSICTVPFVFLMIVMFVVVDLKSASFELNKVYSYIVIVNCFCCAFDL